MAQNMETLLAPAKYYDYNFPILVFYADDNNYYINYVNVDGYS